jgi:uncharacterized membrane protein
VSFVLAQNLAPLGGLPCASTNVTVAISKLLGACLVVVLLVVLLVLLLVVLLEVSMSPSVSVFKRLHVALHCEYAVPPSDRRRRGEPPISPVA